MLVDCWAPWCGRPVLAPTIEALAKDYARQDGLLQLNTDENPKVAAQFAIRSIPTLFIFVDGKLTETIIGAVPRQYIEVEAERVPQIKFLFQAQDMRPLARGYTG